jgi:hypothetical protein
MISVHNGVDFPSSTPTTSDALGLFCDAQPETSVVTGQPAHAATAKIPHTSHPVWAERLHVSVSSAGSGANQMDHSVVVRVMNAKTNQLLASCSLPVQHCILGEQYNIGLVFDESEGSQFNPLSYLFLSLVLKDTAFNQTVTALSSLAPPLSPRAISAGPNPLHKLSVRVVGFDGDAQITSELFRRSKRSSLRPDPDRGFVVCVAHVVADGDAYRDHIVGTVDSMTQKSLNANGFEDTLPGLPFTTVPMRNQGALRAALGRSSGFRMTLPAPLASRQSRGHQRSPAGVLEWDEDFEFWVPDNVVRSPNAAIALDFHYCELGEDPPSTSSHRYLDAVQVTKRTHYAALSIVFLEDLFGNESHDGEMLAFQDIPVSFVQSPDASDGIGHGFGVELGHWTPLGLVEHLLPGLSSEQATAVGDTMHAIGVSEVQQEPVSARNQEADLDQLREEIVQLRKLLRSQTRLREEAEKREAALRDRLRDESRKAKATIQRQQVVIDRLESAIRSTAEKRISSEVLDRGRRGPVQAESFRRPTRTQNGTTLRREPEMIRMPALDGGRRESGGKPR